MKELKKAIQDLKTELETVKNSQREKTLETHRKPRKEIRSPRGVREASKIGRASCRERV